MRSVGPPCRTGCCSACDGRLWFTESRRAGSRHRARPHLSENSHAPRGDTRDTLYHTSVSPPRPFIQNQIYAVRVEVSSQFFNVTSGNITRMHVKADGAVPVNGVRC